MSMVQRINPAWWSLIRISSNLVAVYRWRMWFWIFRMLIQLWILRLVWSAAYGARTELDGISLAMMLTYLSLSMWQSLVIGSSLDAVIFNRIETGRVATDMIRPMSFMKQMVAIDIGAVRGRLPVIGVVLVAVALVGSTQGPASIGALIAYGIAIVLGLLIQALIWAMIGLCAFWLVGARSLTMVVTMISSLLSGALFPLWFMPTAVRVVLQFLPFQAYTYLPLSIYTGQVTGGGIVGALGVQVLWIGLLILGLRSMWNRAQRRLVVQGG